MSEPEFDRPLPRNTEAERAVLGTILADNQCFFRVQPIVDVEDFADEKNQSIFRNMGQMLRRGDTVDLITLKAAIPPRELEAMGSPYISLLTDGIPDFANVERYAAEVAKQGQRRRIIWVTAEASKQAMAGETEPQDISSNLIRELSLVAVREDRQARPLFKTACELHAQADERAKAGIQPGITTGFDSLDSRHVIRPTFIVIGSPHGHGKSALLLNLANAIVRSGPCALFTLEMTEQEVSDRFMAMRARVPHHRIRSWQWLSTAERKRIDAATESLRNDKILVTRKIRTIEGIVAECRRIHAVHGLKAVFVDYIQLIRSTGRNREDEMARAAEQLLELAVDLNIAVIVASQVNKDRHTRENHRLTMEDLKYASAIGDSARVGILLQRPYADDKADPMNRPCQVKLQLEKNNEGQAGDLDFHFDPVFQTFAGGGCVENDCQSLLREKAS